MTFMARILGLPLLLLLLVTPVSSETPEATDTHESPESHESHQGHHRNHIGVFLGVTAGGEAEGGGEESGTGTIGVEYERRLTRLLGIGIIGEFAGGERRDHVGIIPLSFRPTERTRFVLAGGWERASGSALFSDHTEALLRVGFAYRFEPVPGNTVYPEINIDFVDGEELIVVGATIGWGF